jgi:hypothetical protein
MMSAGRVLRFVLAAVAGLAVAIVALGVASLVGATLVVRRLLGRRGAGAVRFGPGHAAARTVFRQAASRRTPAGGEVIDVEVREVVSGKN